VAGPHWNSPDADARYPRSPCHPPVRGDPRETSGVCCSSIEDIAGCTALPEILDGARHNGPIKPVADSGCRLRIAWGLKDRMLPFMRYGAPMLAAVPAAEFKLMPGVGHVPMIDDPALVADEILDFVETTEAQLNSR
jgi:pimeloyl-ACP methyl ester carboxylesterase